MNIKIENEATVIVVEMLGILGVDEVIKNLNEAEGTEEERGYKIINYLFKNLRKVKPQMEELIDLLLDEEVNILKGIAKLKDDEEVVNFFTELFGDLMESV